jgi:hypothetical protein
MLDTPRARIVIVCLLLFGHGLLFPLYAVQPVNEEAWVFADETEFLDDPDRYLNDPVVSGGIVQDTDPIVIRVKTTGGTNLVTVTDTTITPKVGDKLRVFGTLIGPSTINAQNAFVVPQQGRWYAWGISFLAGIWVLTRLLRHWRVEWSTLGFEVRTELLTVRKAIEWIQGLGRSNDA